MRCRARAGLECLIRMFISIIPGSSRAKNAKPCGYRDQAKPHNPMLSYLHAFHAGNKADIVSTRDLDVVFAHATPAAALALPRHACGQRDVRPEQRRGRETGEADDGILAAMAGPETACRLAPISIWSGSTARRAFEPRLARDRRRAAPVDKLTFVKCTLARSRPCGFPGRRADPRQE